MSAHTPEAGFDLTSAAQRRALWIVLLINLGLTVGFAFAGLIGDSSALLANALDSASDSLVFVISLLALSHGGGWKRVAVRISAFTLLLFATGVMIDAVRRFFEGSEPLGPTIMVMGLIGAAANALCLWLLIRLRHKDVNLRAATTFSLNDFASNGGVFVAGGLVIWTGSNAPDLIVGAAVAAFAVIGAVSILDYAHRATEKSKER